MREYFKSLPDQSTPLTGERLNGIFNGEESIEKLVVGDIECKNIFDEQWGELNKRYANVTTSKFPIQSQEGGTYCANPIKLDRTKSYLIMSTNSSYTTNGIYFYDENGIFLTRVYLNFGKVITIPTDAYYMTFNLTDVTDISDLANYTWQVEYIDSETDTSTPYSKMKKYGYNSQESMGKIVVDDISSSNLFNINGERTDKYSIVSTISENTLSTECTGAWSYLEYYNIKVKKGQTYTVSFDFSNPSNNSMGLDVRSATDSSILGSVNSTDTSGSKTFTFIADDDVVTMRICSNNTGDVSTNTVTYSKIQIKKGTVIDKYTPYKEFSNKQIYSTNEQVIGTWIDGKPLYRKTIKSTTPSIGGNNIIPHGISNIDSIANAYGCAVYLDHYYVLGAHESSTRFVNIKNVNETNITIVVSTDWATSFAGGFTITLEYTKN